MVIRSTFILMIGSAAFAHFSRSTYGQFGGGLKISPPKIDIPKPPKIDIPKPPKIDVPSVNDIKNGAAELDRKRLEAQRELSQKAAEADRARLEAQRKADEAARELDRKRLELMRNAEHSASEQSYFAYRNWVESKNSHIRPIVLQPGTLHYQIIEPLFAGKLNISRIRFYFGAFVPANMAAITFDDRVYVNQPFDPNDLGLALLMAHEMTHSTQYARLGGEKQFAWRYFGQIGQQIRSGNFNIIAVHDKLELEQEANRVEGMANSRVDRYISDQRNRQIAAERQQNEIDRQRRMAEERQRAEFERQRQMAAERERSDMRNDLANNGIDRTRSNDPRQRESFKPSETYASNIGFFYTKVMKGDGTFGARVSRAPMAGTPAATIGLEVGDIVIELDGEKFRSEQNVLEHRYRTTVRLINVRDNRIYDSEVMIP